MFDDNNEAFLASTYWRGSMNVGDMRLFHSLADAIDYVIWLKPCAVRFCRIYELSSNASPKLRTNEKAIYQQIEKALGI